MIEETRTFGAKQTPVEPKPGLQRAKVALERSQSPVDDHLAKDSIQSIVSNSSVDKHNYNTVASVSEQCFGTLKKLLHTFVSDALRDESPDQNTVESSARVDPSVVEEISGIIYRKCKQLLKAVARQDIDKWMEQLMITTPTPQQISNFRSIIVEFDALLVAYRQTGVAQEDRIQNIGRMILKAPELLNQIGKLIVHIVNTLDEFDKDKMERTLENSIKKNISQASQLRSKESRLPQDQSRNGSSVPLSNRAGELSNLSTQRSGQMDALMAHLQEEDFPSEEMMLYRLNNGPKETSSSRDGRRDGTNLSSRRSKEQPYDSSFEGRHSGKEVDLKRLIEQDDDEQYEAAPAQRRQPENSQGCYFDSFRSKFRPAGSIINEEDGESQDPTRSITLHEGNSKHEQSTSNVLNKTNILSVHERSKQSGYQDPREHSDPEDEDVFDRTESPQKARSQKPVQSSRGFLDEPSFRFQNGRGNGMEGQAASGNQAYSSRTSKCSLPSDQRGLISLGYQHQPSGNTPQHTGRYDTEFESGPALPGNALQNLQAGESLLDLEGLPLKPVHPNKPLNKHDKELEDFLAASSPAGGLKPQKFVLGQSRPGTETENHLPRGAGKLQTGHRPSSFGEQPYQSEQFAKDAGWGEDFSQSHHDSKTYEAFDEDEDEDPKDLLDRLAHSRAANTRHAGLL